MEKQKKPLSKKQQEKQSNNFILKLDISNKLGLNIKKDNTYIIPIFIPHRGCKNECVFCNQRKISGEKRNVTLQEVRDQIEYYLSIYKDKTRQKQIAFFGGSFTGLDEKEQIELLDLAGEYIEKEQIRDIRISTRPDYINENILKILKEKKVAVIELGVQSMDDKVLKAAKRGHSSKDVIYASTLIKKYGFILGHQVMVGLPCSSKRKEIGTANNSLKLKPDLVRIYPVYVLKDSELYNMYENSRYIPLKLKDSIERTKEMYLKYVKGGVNVIRIGLQATEEICENNSDIVGPVCDNYKERVLSKIAKDQLKSLMNKKAKEVNKQGKVTIFVPKDQINFVVGTGKENIKELESEFSVKLKIKSLE